MGVRDPGSREAGTHTAKQAKTIIFGDRISQMLIQTKYHTIREQIQQGDLIAFSGKGHVSELIKLFTLSSVSHVAIVMKGKIKNINTGKEIIVNDIIESTTLNGFAGVCINRLSKRLKNYNGEVWWLPLSDIVRKKMDFEIFYDWLKNQKKKLYDSWQAIGAGFDFIPENKEDFDKFFCSELVAGALEKSGATPNINCSEVTPIELCRWNIYKENYYQLSGKSKEIKRFNIIKI